MATKRLQACLTDQRGAVAATYALALVGLVMIGGVAWDYSRMAMLDSELQDAADQAALAAATQLDGTPNSITRATARASDLVSNQTYMANDTNAAGTAVTVASTVYYKTRADAEAGTNGFTDNARSGDAHFVRVRVNTRSAFYAFTPIIGALTSKALDATATAGMGSSVCRVPPVMMCNPAVDPTQANVDSLIGKGLVLKANGGGGAWAPGDFGFLDVGTGANALSKLMGYANPPGDCVDVTAPSTQPGAVNAVMNEFNTRFDIYDSGDSINCYSDNLCPPSDNSRKDVVQRYNSASPPGSLSKNDCGFTTGVGGNGWRLSPDPYRPTSATTYTQHITAGTKTAYPDAMGFPRDIMHAWHEPISAGDARFGDGSWDIDAYWRVNHGAAWASQLTTSVAGRTYPTRYEVYKWERTNSLTPEPRTFTGSDSKKYAAFRAPMCRTGSSPGATAPDRRVLPVAMVDCTGLNGKQVVNPLAWVDVFLVEPSLPRSGYTDTGDIYVEIIGKTQQGSGGAANQYVRRDKPYLVR